MVYYNSLIVGSSPDSDTFLLNPQPLRVEKLEHGLNGIVGGLERLEKRAVSGIKLVVDPTETI